MKKLWLVSALSLGLVLLAGCNAGRPSQTTENPDNKQMTQTSAASITNSDDIISLYNESNAITCIIRSTDNTESATMYIKDWMITQRIESLYDEWENIVMTELVRDGMSYIWWDLYEDWFWTSATFEAGLEEALQWFDRILSEAETTCTKWVEDDSVFNLPADIEFTSVDDLMNVDDGVYGEIDYDEDFWWIEWVEWLE